jgi:NADH-quinone oxidoreductase subunit H
MFKLSHCVKVYVMTALFCALFLGGLTTGIIALDAVLLLVLCAVVTFITMTVPHAICARFKVEQLFKFYWTVVAGLAALSLILVWIGL